MLQIKKGQSLKEYTTLKIGQKAEFFAVLSRPEDLLEAISFAKMKRCPIMIIGGGSNLLLSKNIKGLVLKNEIKGLKILKKSKTQALVEGRSGESWSAFVNYTVKQGLSGLENLFLIPGTVGASPVQNIGAYGVEIKDCFHSLQAIDLRSGKERTFNAEDCRFAYRDSVFKNKYKGRFFILSVTFKLKTKADFHLDYGSIKEELALANIYKPTAFELIHTIEKIRNSKLPNPSVLPNAGSFFKNPSVSKQHFNQLKQKFPDIKAFPLDTKKYKLAAGWLIENVGFKGKRFKSVGVHDKQALILVNFGGAKASEMLSLVKKIQMAVLKKFGVYLEPEVNII